MNWLKINKNWLVLLLFDAFSFMCIKCMKHIHSFIPKFNTRPFIFCSFGANVYALKTDELNVITAFHKMIFHREFCIPIHMLFLLLCLDWHLVTQTLAKNLMCFSETNFVIIITKNNHPTNFLKCTWNMRWCLQNGGINFFVK
jgi:hypothetical protein